MAHHLDEMDRKIVALLQRDGRLPNVEIARLVGMAEATVRKRIEKLLADGVIRIIAVPEAAAVGLPSSVLIFIQTDLNLMNEAAQRLAAIPEVHRVSMLTGTYDIVIEAVLPSAEHLLSFLIDKIATVPGVRRTETSQILKAVKRCCDWNIPESPGQKADAAPETGGEPIVPGAIVISP